MRNRIIVFALLLFSVGSCEKITYSVDNPIAGLPTSVLMHMGSGDNPDYIPNTLAAAKFGLSILDGIEHDIQISNDGTLWLDHDNEVRDCDGNIIGCFQEMTDDEIREYDTCNDTVRYNTLESVFELISSEYPESWISLDVKGQYCEILNTPELMKQMASEILRLTIKYKREGKVLVESSSLAFMNELDNQDIIGQCVISLGDIDKGIADATATDARGISLKYGEEELDADVVSLIHKKGYGLIVWVINEPEDIVDVWNSKPDFIQTDNADFMKYIPK
ncbi:MAG: glycerophosphodiester phosphodiesterase [Draconibacterium sp.]|nr:glycerophosphodiester phosphodiesterase [Draconibacterium sp.]